MKYTKNYYISTGLYAITGLVALYLLYLGVIEKRWLFGALMGLIIYVAFDNVFCKDRMKKNRLRKK